ncbi:exodeoxyribonuclease III [Tahibacter caeni]|uniref:exodeoxyribonuclease III n=1 Tax=Tahibacter caeni TaxID=1453545 RepID=UPI002148562B|nr:exodeoxyribonuclease III [Tahibacter caeni]
MKIATWNVNSLNVRMPHLKQWLVAAQPDIVALQETKLEDSKFPDTELAALGYRSVFSGQKTYNGVALLSRHDMPQNILTGVPGLDDPQRRILIADVGDLRIANLYVVNGQAVGSEKYAYKLDWLARVTDHLAGEAARHPNLVVLGDFNIAPEDRDVHDPLAWKDQILCSEPERAALRKLLGIGLVDTFREFHSNDGAFSWWDYRQAAFRRNLGLRIDLVLASQALRPRFAGASIDLEPRRWERPSDHAPALLELNA